MTSRLRKQTNEDTFVRTKIICSVLAALLSYAWVPVQAQAQDQKDRLAPVLNVELPNKVPDEYIVVLKKGIAREGLESTQWKARKLGAKIRHTYQSAIVGFSANLSDASLQKLRAVPEIAYIEVDQVGTLNTVQAGPPTGLDRTSERLLPLDNRYTYSETGAGVHVYVIDTGIRPTHTEFGGRVSGGTNTMSSSAGTDDCHGHGTHVAGTVGGVTYGVAKAALLHPVRAGDCFNTYLAPVIAAVDWVTTNRVLPAVANLSSGFGISPTLDTAIANSVASGVTYTVAAGNNAGDACSISPARAPAAITVGAIDPLTDIRAGFSNFGTCVDLFAPGVATLSADFADDKATAVHDGTSMAAPHVAGVAARYLQGHPGATPAAVWNAIHIANNVATTPGWAGVGNRGAGSPNELLHYGSVNNGVDDGDPHITTVTGLHYDFQDGGEFVALSDGGGMQLQARQTPVASAPWVSVNTAVAAKLGERRVTWQPGLGGTPDPHGLELRIDGELTELGTHELDWGSDGRVLLIGQTTLQMDFPDGTTVMVTPQWWAGQSQWYLTINVFHTMATQGLMGDIEPGSWLEARFADTWRVTSETSLFDYGTDVSTATFTVPPFPKEKIPPVKEENLRMARNVCQELKEGDRQNDCVADVAITGDTVFLEGAQTAQQVQLGATQAVLSSSSDTSRFGELVKLTAFVVKHKAGERIPRGAVHFYDGDKDVSGPVELDDRGQASWSGAFLQDGEHHLKASFVPSGDGTQMFSTSGALKHNVEKASGDDPHGGL